MPEKPEEKPELDWLAEVFCLTEGFSHDWVVPNQMLNLDPEVLAEMGEETPVGRNGKPEDVAQAMIYLADAEFVTGQVLPVNGGYVI